MKHWKLTGVESGLAYFYFLISHLIMIILLLLLLFLLPLLMILLLLFLMSCSCQEKYLDLDVLFKTLKTKKVSKYEVVNITKNN